MSSTVPRIRLAGWFVDETYVKVAGTWRYVYRTVDEHRQVIDVAARKYRSQQRKIRLQDCLRLFHANARYRIVFERSIFPHLAIGCCWQ